MKRIKVLIVDDSALVRKMLNEILNSDPGIDVVGVAQDPYIAREKIKELSPDVLTLDVEMPRMDGLEVLDRVRQNHADLPVIILTASTNRAIAEGSLDRGATAYLLKPFDPEHLRQTVFDALGIESPDGSGSGAGAAT